MSSKLGRKIIRSN